MEAIGEVRLVAPSGHITEGEDRKDWSIGGNGAMPSLDRRSPPEADANDHHGHEARADQGGLRADPTVRRQRLLLAGLRPRRPPDASSGDVKHPSQNHSRQGTNQTHQHQTVERSGAEAQRREDEVGALEPSKDHRQVGDAHAIDFPALQLGKKVGAVPRRFLLGNAFLGRGSGGCRLRVRGLHQIRVPCRPTNVGLLRVSKQATSHPPGFRVASGRSRWRPRLNKFRITP